MLRCGRGVFNFVLRCVLPSSVAGELHCHLQSSLFKNFVYSTLKMSTSTELPLSVLRRNSQGSKSTPKVALTWTTANLVPEALRVDLHVLEDDRMISWLGRKKFVDLCIHGTSGWQDGVSFLDL